MKRYKLILLCAVVISLCLFITAFGDEMIDYDDITETALFRRSSRRQVYGQLEKSIHSLIMNKDYNGAYDMAWRELEALMENLPLDNWHGEYCFRTPEEEILGKLLFPDSEVAQQYRDYPLLLKTVGWLMVDAGQAADAVEYLTLAVSMNPAYIGAWQELIICYEQAGDHENALALLQTVKDLCLLPEDVAWYYRRAGFTLYEQGYGDLAKQYQLYSLIFEDSAMAHNELEYLDAKSGEPRFDYSVPSEERTLMMRDAARQLTKDGKAFVLQDPHRKALEYLAGKTGDGYGQCYSDALSFFILLYD